MLVIAGMFAGGIVFSFLPRELRDESVEDGCHQTTRKCNIHPVVYRQQETTMDLSGQSSAYLLDKAAFSTISTSFHRLHEIPPCYIVFAKSNCKLREAGSPLKQFQPLDRRRQAVEDPDTEARNQALTGHRRLAAMLAGTGKRMKGNRANVVTGRRLQPIKP